MAALQSLALCNHAHVNLSHVPQHQEQQRHKPTFEMLHFGRGASCLLRCANCHPLAGSHQTCSRRITGSVRYVRSVSHLRTSRRVPCTRRPVVTSFTDHAGRSTRRLRAPQPGDTTAQRVARQRRDDTPVLLKCWFTCGWLAHLSIAFRTVHVRAGPCECVLLSRHKCV